MTTLQEVAEMLDLPTAEDVADLLRVGGIKGKPIDACKCPVAMFASRATGRTVWSGGDDLGFHPDETQHGDPVLSVAAQEFIHRFDDKDPAFADLVAGP